MRTTLLFKSLLSLLLLSGFCFSCGDYEIERPEIQEEAQVLYLNYKIGNEILTYSVDAESHELKLDNIYCFFFTPNTGGSGAGQYQFYSRIAFDGHTAQGSVQMSLPSGKDPKDAWHILVVANLDQYADKGGPTVGVDAWINNKLSVGSTDLAAAKAALMLYAGNSNGMPSAPLPMTAEIEKSGNTKKIDITLERRAARIDIINQADDFKLESVYLGNARKQSVLWGKDDRQEVANSSDYINYTGNEKNISGEMIQGELYCLPNFVFSPTANDTKTTHLLIKGNWKNSSTPSYYRININNKGVQHILSPNGVYVVNIIKVKAGGGGSPGAANSDDIEYFVNERDGNSTYDQYGNKLTLSHQYLSFSPLQGGVTQVEVTCTPGTTNAITGNWTVSPGGTDALKFSAVDDPTSPQKQIKITTLTDNLSYGPYHAVAMVKWGNISQPIYLTQNGINDPSLLGISVSPSPLYIPARDAAAPSAKLELQLIVKINEIIPGFNLADASTYIAYDDLGTDYQGWLSFKTAQPAYDATNSILSYTLLADPLPASVFIRSAGIKFTVKSAAIRLTTEALVFQSEADIEEPPVQMKEVSLRMYEKAFQYDHHNDKGRVPRCYNNFHGFELSKLNNNDLQFSLNDKDYMYYELEIRSDQKWEIVPDVLVKQKIDFFDPIGTEQLKGGGLPLKTEKVKIQAKSDMVIENHPTGQPWQGSFVLKFADGTSKSINVFQEAIIQYFNKHIDSKKHGIYFYKTKRINGVEWLDRPIGAKNGNWFDMALDKGDMEAYDKRSGLDWDWRSFHFDGKDCPKGFTMISADVCQALNSNLHRKASGDNEGQIYFYDESQGVEIPLNVAGVPGAYANAYLVEEGDADKKLSSLLYFGCLDESTNPHTLVDLPPSGQYIKRKDLNMNFLPEKLFCIDYDNHYQQDLLKNLKLTDMLAYHALDAKDKDYETNKNLPPVKIPSAWGYNGSQMYFHGYGNTGHRIISFKDHDGIDTDADTGVYDDIILDKVNAGMIKGPWTTWEFAKFMPKYPMLEYKTRDYSGWHMYKIQNLNYRLEYVSLSVLAFSHNKGRNVNVSKRRTNFSGIAPIWEGSIYVKKFQKPVLLNCIRDIK